MRTRFLQGLFLLATAAASSISVTAQAPIAGSPYRSPREVNVGIDLGTLALDSQHGRLYIGNTRGVFAYDTEQQTLTGQVSPAAGAGLAVLSDLGWLLIARPAAFEKIDLATGKPLGSIPRVCQGILIGPSQDGQRLYFQRTNKDSVEVCVQDVNGARIGQHGFARPPQRIANFALGPEGRLFYFTENRIDVIDSGTWSVRQAWTIPGKQNIESLRFDGRRNRVLVGLEDDLALVDGTTGAVLSRLDAGRLVGADGASQVFVCWRDDGKDTERGVVTIGSAESGRLVRMQQLMSPGPLFGVHFDSRTRAVYSQVSRLPKVRPDPDSAPGNQRVWSLVVFEPVK